VKFYVWRKTFKEHLLGMFSPKFANMPLMMKKFKCVSIKSTKILKNASLGMVKVNMNGTRLALNLVQGQEN